MFQIFYHVFWLFMAGRQFTRQLSLHGQSGSSWWFSRTLSSRILPTGHCPERARALRADLAKEEAERTLAIFNGELSVNLMGFCVFNFVPKPVLLDNFVPISAIKFLLFSLLNLGTHIKITRESFGSNLAIFTSDFLNCSPPLRDEHWVPCGKDKFHASIWNL